MIHDQMKLIQFVGGALPRVYNQINLQVNTGCGRGFVRRQFLIYLEVNIISGRGLIKDLRSDVFTVKLDVS